MTHDPRTALLSAALTAAERGWPVFPLRPGDKRPALHGEARCPHTGPCTEGHRKWEQRATTNPDRIRAAWSTGPYNIAIATGPAGLVVVDLDVPKNNTKDAPSGATTFQALCERAGQPMPTTYTVRTPSGGGHLYFTAPPGARLPNTAGALGPRIDTRAGGGYVVAPTSTTPTGTYDVLDNAPAAPLPQWLLSALAPRSRPAPARFAPITVSASRYADAAFNNEVRAVATAAEGTRNATLLRAARALGRLVASGDLPRAQVEEALSWAAATNGGQSQRYYDDVITRALNWSIAHNPQGRTA
ncbi:bifunctional DNA primase/polymerase [Streptomyces natalensis]|uniref:DNA primase n=1 Tax=Streptomyces natalensis ATCC 27448 TaxID=1240678 RepID=A0A0D7CND1_9ACTN|nr:bifunctional DNA primase/polymerase [Streptomyces natalensis]KIZ17365.1 DNA primase [Streptomyces natalensis ATCC 27448]